MICVKLRLGAALPRSWKVVVSTVFLSHMQMGYIYIYIPVHIYIYIYYYILGYILGGFTFIL